MLMQFLEYAVNKQVQMYKLYEHKQNIFRYFFTTI